MIDKKFFRQTKKRYQISARRRQQLAEISNQVQFLSKQAIFAGQRGELKQSAALLKQAGQYLVKGEKLSYQMEDLEKQSGYNAAREEYVEAALFYNFLTNSKIGAIAKLNIPLDVYIGAISDLVGEMARYAVKQATLGRGQKVTQVVKIASELVAILAAMNLLGNLRSKYDQARHHLRKLEDIQYDLAVKRHV